MEIVDRYLGSVKKCLPAEQAEDIIKELSENISSQIEDQERELDRPLTESEVEAILKQHGHPLLVASRYGQEQRTVSFGRQIIGPMLFPFYIRVLKFNLGLTSVILIIIWGALFVSGQPVGSFPGIFLYQLLIQFAIVTLIFWLMDRHFAKSPDSWDPRKSYGVCHPAMTSNEDGPRIPRAKSLSQLIALSVALVWLRLVQHSHFLLFGPAAAFLSIPTAWGRLYGPVAALILFGMVNAGVVLVRPDWVRFFWSMHIVRRLGGLALCYFVLRSGDLIVVANLTGVADPQKLARIVNQTFYYCIVFTAVIFVVQIANAIRRLVSTTPRFSQVRPT